MEWLEMKRFSKRVLSRMAKEEKKLLEGWSREREREDRSPFISASLSSFLAPLHTILSCHHPHDVLVGRGWNSWRERDWVSGGKSCSRSGFSSYIPCRKQFSFSFQHSVPFQHSFKKVTLSLPITYLVFLKSFSNRVLTFLAIDFSLVFKSLSTLITVHLV